MKTIYRVLVLGLLTMALTAVTTTSLFAQDPCADVEAKQAVYKKFTDNYASKEIAKRKIAVEAGEEYIQKYGNCPDDKEIVTYLNSTVPGIKERNKKEETATATNALYTKFDTALKAKNTADIFSVGKEILAQEPDMLDVTLVLATAGYDQAAAKPPVDTYNNDAVNYARSAIQKIEAGTKSTTGDFGVLTYSYKNKDNALGWMNYIIGYVDYYRLGKKDEGLSYLYKAAMAPGTATTKTNAYLYQTIGAHYREEVVRLGKEIVSKIDTAGKETDETKALFALEKGYADRAIDAYARAYKVADAKDKAYKDGLYDTVKEIYKLRFEGKEEGVDAYVATLTSKPMPDPTTKVEPVVEDAATATTSGATSPMTTPGSTKPASTTDTKKPPTTMTKPATTPAKPATTTDTKKPPTTDTKKPPTTPMSSTNSESTTKVTVTKNADETSPTNSAKTKTPAKKPAPKKKGTR